MSAQPKRLEPDPRTGGYTTTSLTLQLVLSGGGSQRPVPLTLDRLEAQPDVLQFTPQAQDDPTRIEVIVGLTDEVVRDPVRLQQLAGTSVTVLATVSRPDVAAGSPARTYTDRQVVEILGAPWTIHWRQLGAEPGTPDVPVELDPFADSEASLELWVEEPGASLMNSQLSVHPLDFGDVPLRPLQATTVPIWLDATPRARLDLRLDRQHLNPSPPGMGLRVHAHRPGYSADRQPWEGPGGMANGIVPIRLRPARFTVDLEEPRDPVPADGQTHPLHLRLRPERTGRFSGPVQLAVEGPAGRVGGILRDSQVHVAEEADGLATTELTVPTLTYRPGTDYRDQVVVSLPGGAEGLQEAGRAPIWLAPTLALELQPRKAGLEWEWFPREWPAAERVREVLGTVMVSEQMPRDPDRQLTRTVAQGQVVAVAAPDTRNTPTLLVDGDDTGGFSIRPDGLAPREAYRGEHTGVAQLEAGELKGHLAADLRERLALLEDARLVRARQGSHPLDELVSTETMKTIETWRLQTTAQLAANPPDQADKARSAIDIVESGTCYTAFFARQYYAFADTIIDQLKELISDIFSLGVSISGVAERIGTTLARGLGRLADSASISGSALRNLAAAAARLARRFADLVPGLHEICDQIDNALALSSTGTQWLADAVKGLFTFAGRVLRHLGGMIIDFVKQVIPTAIRQLREHLGAISPVALKWIESLLEEAFARLHPGEVMPSVAGAVGASTAQFDPYPFVMQRVVGRVLDDAEHLRVPTDPGPACQRLRDRYGERLHAQHAMEADIARREENLAIFKLGVAVLQAVFMFWGVLYKGAVILGTEIARVVSGLILGTDVFQHTMAGLKHASDLVWGMGGAIRMAGTSGYAVVELTWA